MAGLTACGTDVIAHGDLDEIGDRGNFPQPAQTRCGDLPDGLEPIPGLASAWVVVALPDAVSSDDEPVPAGSAMVRLADHALDDCDTAFFNFTCSPREECGWATRFTLPNLESGSTHDLPALDGSDFTVITPWGNGPGDAGVVVLRRVTPDCVVGEVRDFDDDTGLGSGGFVAEVCRRQCIPGSGIGC